MVKQRVGHNESIGGVGGVKWEKKTRAGDYLINLGSRGLLSGREVLPRRKARDLPLPLYSRLLR